MLEEIITNGANALGIKIGKRELEQFSIFTQLLIEWNEKMNLTRIIDPDEIAVKHHLDSLTVLSAVKIPQGAVVADVGTGAGFPGIPLAIVRPDLEIVLIEATKKKLTFLEHVVEELSEYKIASVDFVHARAEEVGRLPEHRERYDVVTALAVADMRVLAEYCLPLVKSQGIFVAMKGPEVDGELAQARPGIGTLGGGRPEVVHLTLPGTDMERNLVVIKKSKPTPEQFPRPSAQIAKKPL